MTHTLSAEQLLTNKSKIDKLFDRVSGRYDLATLLNQGYSKDLRTSVRRMKLRGDETIADLCCGTGKSTEFCLQAVPNGKVLAVDFSAGMLEKAKETYAKATAAGKVQWQQADVMQLDWPDESLDAIFMAYGIRNMPDYEACLRNLRRMLKPGGVIVFHEYSLRDAAWVRLYWRMLGYGVVLPVSALLSGHTTLFRYLIRSVQTFPDPQTFSELLAKCDFEEVQALPLGSWRKPLLHSFIARKPE